MQKVILLCLALCLLTGLAFGQTAALTGVVTDQSAAVVPDATITAVETSTGVITRAVSSSAGYYHVPVPPGNYRIEATASGFAPSVINAVVNIGEVVTADFSLKLGTTSEQVAVTAEAPLLTTDTGQLTSDMSPKEFETLPIILSDGARPIDGFIYSSLPGATSAAGGNSINGGQQGTNQILIDGLTIGRFDANDAVAEFMPSTDAVGEFTVVMSNFSAEYGQTGGGIASFFMKSGTNEYHGSAYEYNENPIMNAAGFDENAADQPKSSIRQNDYGATFGGPIKKNKTFFFLAWESNRKHEFSLAGKTTLPTKDALGGDFSAWLGSEVGTDALGRPVYQNEIYNPTTTRTVAAGATDPVTGLVNNSGAAAIIRDPFASGGKLNVIPQSYFSQAIMPLLSLFPTPNLAGLTRNMATYNPGSTCCPLFDEDKGSFKVDQVITDNQKLSAFLTWNARDRFSHSGGAVWAPYPDQPISTVKEQLTGGPDARLEYTWTINPSSINELSAGFNRFPNDNGISGDSKYSLAVAGTDPSCFSPLRLSAGNNPIAGLDTQFGIGCGTDEVSNSYLVHDTYSHVVGKHSLKFGAQYIRYRYNTLDISDVGGTFTFSSNSTNLPGFTSSTGNPYASMLLGAVNSGSRGIYTTEPGYRIGQYSFFAQDDWKVTPKLTLNVGVRWELPTPKEEAYDRMSGFDPAIPNPGADGYPGALAFLGNCPASNCLHESSFENWDFKLFAPRIGLAYQINDKLVFRGGYGITYDPSIEFGYGTQTINGFNDEIALNAGTSATGFRQDPVIYLSQLNGASLPSAAQVGVQPYTGKLPNYDPSQVNGGWIDFLPSDALRLPYIQNWSAGFQYQVTKDMLVEANYVGSKGTRLIQGDLTQSYNIDQVPVKYMGLGDILNDDLATDLANPATAKVLAQYGITKLPFPNFESNPTGTTVAIALQPYPQYGAVISDNPNNGMSTYHSLQLTAHKRTTSGLTFIASYSWSKTLTDADSAIYGSGGTFQDIYNMKLEKAIAAFDFTNYFKFTWIYDLPIGQGKRFLGNAGKFDRLFSGWQISMIQNYHSGDPLSIYASVGSGINNPGIRPDYVAGQPLTVSGSGIDTVNGTPYLNPNAFTNPPTSPINGYALSLGDVPRFLPDVRGPWGQSETAAIIKNTRISERFTLQIRADAQNVFNRVIRGDPDTSIGDGPLFGRILSDADGPRVMQVAARLNF